MTSIHKLRRQLLLLAVCLVPADVPAQKPSAAPPVTFRETIWLDTGRGLFVAGERVSLHAVILEKDTYFPSALSSCLKLELIDQEGNKLYKENLETNGSKVFATIPLPPALKSGWYWLRAYTNWMRNFPAEEFSLLPVRVINPADLQTGQRVPFPVEEDSGETAATGSTGMNEPEPDVLISEKDGYLEVRLREGHTGAGQAARLLVHQTYTFYWHDNQIGAEIMPFRVPMRKIPPGMVQFTLFNRAGAIIARRLWSGYDPEKHVVSMFPDTGNPGIRTRHACSYRFPSNLQPEPESLFQARIALAEPGYSTVARLPGLPGWNADAMIPSGKAGFQLWLNGHHYPDEVAMAFFPDGFLAPPVQGIENMPALENPGIFHLPETRSGILSGRVTDRNNGNGIEGVGVGLTLLNDNSFDAVMTNREGVFAFALPGRHGSHDYILNYLEDPDPAWFLSVHPEYDQRTSLPDKREFILTQQELDFIRNLNIILQIKELYGQDPLSVFDRTDPSVRKDRFFDSPDRSILTDDYIELANIREVFYEVVPDVNIRRRGDHLYLNVYNGQTLAEGYPVLVLLDGIPITRHNELLELPSDRLSRIDVKNRLYLHGSCLFSGIVSMISRNRDFAGLPLPESAVVASIDLPVPAEPMDWTNTVVIPSHQPDLRTTILWNSGVSLPNGTIGFNTNDLTGTLEITVCGFDTNGLWWSGGVLLQNE